MSAHVLAWILNSRDPSAGAVPIRLGEPNPQTEWLFEYANVQLPEERTDCRITVGDVASAPHKVSSQAPLSEALQTIRQEQSRLLGIVDSTGQLLGVIGSRTPRINQLLQSRVEDYGSILLDLDLLHRGLGLTRIRGHHRLQQAERLVIAANSEDRLQRDLHAGDIVICGLHARCIELADAARVTAVICCTSQLSELEDVISRTKVPVYHFPESIITLIGNLPGTVPCWTVMEEEYGVVDADAVISEARKALVAHPEGLMVMRDGQFIGSFHQHHLIDPPRPRLSLVDHFEKAQSISGFEEAEIVQIIDHHRVGDIETDGPLEIDCRQWGSTASILFSRLEAQGVEPPKNIAILLLGALLSDTLGLQSPTTTAVDRSIAERLAVLADEDLESFLLTLLQKNDQVATANPHRLLQTDCKQFKCGETSFLVSQVETVDLAGISEAREGELTEVFHTLVEQQDVAFGVLMFTDVLKRRSLLRLVSRDQKWRKMLLPESVGAADARWLEDEWVSRKRQVIPFILQRLRSA